MTSDPLDLGPRLDPSTRGLPSALGLGTVQSTSTTVKTSASSP
jgi:hypothetical protein